MAIALLEMSPVKSLRCLLPTTLTGRLILLSLILLFTLQIAIISIFVLDFKSKHAENTIRFSLVRLISLVRILDNSDKNLFSEIIKANHGNNLFLYFSSEPLIPTNRNTEYEKRAKDELNQPQREIYINTALDLDADLSTFPIPKEGEVRPRMTKKQIEHMRKNSTSLLNFLMDDKKEDSKAQKQFDANPQLFRHRHKNRNLKPVFYGSIKMSNGNYLIFAHLIPMNPLPPFSSKVIYAIIICTILGTALFYLLIKGITAPLKQLANQADIISRNYKAELPPIAGPKEIQELHASFIRMQQSLSSFISDRTRILASISHDLKTPLTSMMLRAQFLPDCEDKEKLIATIDNMSRMVKATLAFARSDEHLTEIRDLHLPSVLETICNSYQDNGKDVTFETLSPFKTALCFKADVIDIQRIMQNLIDNALQYGTKAIVTLKEEAQCLVIAVQDNGPGIPTEKFEDVFAPFFRLDKARNTNDAHVGLGLSIVRNTVLKQGGKVELKNLAPGLQVTIIYHI